MLTFDTQMHYMRPQKPQNYINPFAVKFKMVTAPTFSIFKSV